ncbi:MAG: hypothetical protein A3F84_06935, partial [Candidatus Handelsmanbacteria bacterium RIFCSPLOWO2_12_FULL_64_10]
MPTLARLCFNVPPVQRAAFEAVYREKVVPLLRAHGLVESSERGRATPDSIFSRLFEVRTVPEIVEKQEALRQDTRLKEVLRSAGAGLLWTWGSLPKLGRLTFEAYAAPAGSGTVVPAGPGKIVPAGPGRGHWRTYEVTDGLADVNVYSIHQDRDGYLWFGTNGGGVSQYDGRDWLTFTNKDGLVSNLVRTGFQDREGNLWFGTSGSGVSRYDGRKFTNFTTKDGLANNIVLSIFQDQEGNLWFGTDGGGVSRYNGQTWTTFTARDGLADDHVRSVFQDREGVLWFGADDGGVIRYDGQARPRGSEPALPVLSTAEGSGTKGQALRQSSGQAWTRLTTRDGLASNAVSCIFQDREGNLWFGTEQGLSRYNGRSFTTFTIQQGLAHNEVNSIFQDREGYLWLGTGGGLSRYDGKTFTNFTTQDGLAHKVVRSIFQDREGYLWLGTGGGVGRYDTHSFTTYTAKDGIAYDVVLSLFQGRDRHIWICTEEGVSRYDGKYFTIFSAQDGLPHNYVRLVFQDQKGHFWFSTRGGVSRYDGKTFTIFSAQDGLVSNNVLSIYQDRDGHLWFGTRDHGVSRYDGKRFITYTVSDGLADRGVRSIYQDRDGHLWFGAYGGRVSRYDGERFSTYILIDSGLVNNIIFSIYQDREGYLWFGTEGAGVKRYDGKTFTGFTVKDGLSHNIVRSVLQDQKGHFWFSTYGGGVTQYDGRVFQAMNHLDGLASNQVVPILQDQRGDLWFGTLKGLTRYRPPVPFPPPVAVDAVVADRRHEKATELAIPSTVDLTVFEFHGMSFKTRPEQMVYRYWLRGYDKDWRTTHNRRVEYHDLPRGTYTFEVQAVDRDLVYSERPATVTLRVRVPYERIGWFSALSLAVALVVWQTARVVRRDRRLAAANQDLKRGIEERARLDERLQQLHYLYRLRSALGTARSPEEALRQAGEALMETLAPVTGVGVVIQHDGRTWKFGEPPLLSPRERGEDVSLPVHGEGRGGGESNPQSGGVRYDRGLFWGERERGRLVLFSGMELSEAQERALLDETAGQIARALEARELEMQLLQSARLVSLGQMAAGVAHELNQPLTALSATAGDIYLRLVEDLRLPPEQLKEMMQDVLDLIRRMSGTVDHMRVFSRDTAQEPGVPFSVNEVIRSGLHLIEAQLKSHGIGLRLDLSEALPPVSGNPHQMEQVFLNLLGNARDALDEKEQCGDHVSGIVQPSPWQATPATPLPLVGEG